MSGMAPSPALPYTEKTSPRPSTMRLSASDERTSRIFIHSAFISCLCLQRFGLYIGEGSTLFFSLPFVLISQFAMFATGRAVIVPATFLRLLAFITAVAIGTLIALSYPDSRVGISLTSPLALLVNCLLLIFGPGNRFNREQVFPIFLFYVRICAILGIFQYFIQFFGLSLFAFKIYAPFLKSILVEDRYNFNPIIEYGSTIARSNGFFLLEPSVFSQILILGVCVDFFIFNRIKYLPLYAAGYMVSFSGTGLLSAVFAVPFYILIFYRQAPRLVPLVAAGIVAIILAAVAAPDQFASLAGRTGEFTAPGTSGYARYAAQFTVLDASLDDARSLIGYGPGATERATFFVEGSAGSLQKLLVDYGWIGFILFMAFYLGALWRWDLTIIPLICLSIFVLGGGYLFLSPFYVVAAMLCIWACPPSSQH